MRVSFARSLLIIIPVFCLEFGCAKINSPSGGPKDRESPLIVKSVPQNGTVNFREKEIQVTFNEYVVLDKINEKFMVSPPMAKKPRVFIRGKSVRIGIDEELKDSTTYTFYFQDAIRDLNEGNPINNFQFVFSTGPFIDSLSVTGNIYSALTLNPPENTLVMLYSQLADSNVIKHLPDYLTRAEANGEFRIDNVHPGIYRLYGLKDGDNSKNYNRRDEEFAFYDTLIEVDPVKNFLPVKKDTAQSKPVQVKQPVTPSSTLKTAQEKEPVKPPVIGEFQLILFQAEKKARYLTSSSRKQPYELVYTLSLPPDSLKFRFSIPEVGEKAYFIEKSKNRDTTIVWLTDSTVYNRKEIPTIVQFPFTDSLGITGQKTDTIIMRYVVPKPPRGKVVKKAAYKVNTGNLSGNVRPDKQIVFTAPTPFTPPDTSLIRLYEILKEQKVKLPYKLRKDTANSRRYFMSTELKPGKNYLFIADSAAFISIYGEQSDSTGTRFSVMTPELFGKLVLTTINHTGGRIIQVLDKSEKVVREVYMKADGKIEFPLLEKGFYRVRVIFDLNGDGKWTTGDFDIPRQPEPVSYYPKEIEIKENWDVVEPNSWDLERKNYKDYKLMEIKKTTR